MNPKRALDDMRTIKGLLTEAERISREMGQEEPGAEHLLLAAAELPDGSGARALARVGTDAARIGEALVRERAPIDSEALQDARGGTPFHGGHRSHDVRTGEWPPGGTGQVGRGPECLAS